MNFKNFLNEYASHLDKETDAEYEGLSDFLNHASHLGYGNISPKFLAFMQDHPEHLTEETVSPHQRLKEKLKDVIARKAVRQALERHVKVYGKEIGEPLSHQETATISAQAVREHYAKSPEEQKAALKLAAQRLGTVFKNDRTLSPLHLGNLLTGGNKKTEMCVENPLSKHHGRLVKSLSAFGGSPGAYTHMHTADGKETSYKITCAHGTDGCMVGDEKINPTCLAMSGGYNFKQAKERRGIIDHIRNGRETAKDHAVIVANALKTRAEEAAVEGKIHVFRGQITDEQGHTITSIANEVRKHLDANAKNSLVGYGYTKGPKQALEHARARKTNADVVPEYYVHSHPGPAVHLDDNGSLTFNHENVKAIEKLRAADSVAEKEGLHIGRYVVLGGFNPTTQETHRQPKEITKAEIRKNFEKIDNAVRVFREWDLKHSGELQPDEEPVVDLGDRGYVTVKQGGKDIKIGFKDRKVNPAFTENGHLEYTNRHDGRFSDAENSETVALVSAPVASTANLPAEGEYKNALVHQAHLALDLDGKKLRFSAPGVLHDAHPDLMQAVGYVYGEKKTFRKPEMSR